MSLGVPLVVLLNDRAEFLEHVSIACLAVCVLDATSCEVTQGLPHVLPLLRGRVGLDRIQELAKLVDVLRLHDGMPLP